MRSPKTILKRLLSITALPNNICMQRKSIKQKIFNEKQRKQKISLSSVKKTQIKFYNSKNHCLSTQQDDEYIQRIENPESINQANNEFIKITNFVDINENSLSDEFCENKQRWLSKLLLQSQSQITNSKNELNSLKLKYQRNLSVEQESLERLNKYHSVQINEMLQSRIIDNELAYKVNMQIKDYQNKVEQCRDVQSSYQLQIEEIEVQFEKHMTELCREHFQELKDVKFFDFEVTNPNFQSFKELSSEQKVPTSLIGESEEIQRATPILGVQRSGKNLAGSIVNFFSQIDLKTEKISESSNNILTTPESVQNQSQKVQIVTFDPIQEKINFFNEQCQWKTDLCVYSINQTWLKSYRQIQQFKRQITQQYNEICKSLNFKINNHINEFSNATYLLPLA